MQAEKEVASAEAAQARTREEAEQERLDEALSSRTRLEENSVLRQYLEVETVDLERLTAQAVERLRDVARHALDKVVRLKMEYAEDDRAVLHLEENGLLPPAKDAEHVMALLGPLLPVIWSGWAYIEANIGDDQGRRVEVQCHPQLALGVVVRDVDFDKAKEILRNAADLPGTPITVAPASALSRDGEALGVVVGPASSAYYDRAEGGKELLRRRTRLDSYEGQIRREETRRAEAEETVGSLREFRRRYPKGWFVDQEARMLSERRTAENLAGRAQGLAAEIGRIEEEARSLELQQAKANGLCSQLRTYLAVVENYIRQHESSADERGTTLKAERAKLSKAREERASWLDEATRTEDQAAEASAAARKLGEDARSAQDELRGTTYARKDVAPESGPVDELRDRYDRLRDIYEKKIGADALLRLQREAEKNAIEDRQKFTAKLAAGIDEPQIRAALDSLEDPGDVEVRRQQAIDNHARASGAHGRQTQVEQRAKEILAEAGNACQSFGGTPELGETERPAGPIQADAEAKQAESERLRFEELARQHDKSAGEAERRSSECGRRAGALAKDRDQLATVAGSYEDLLSSCDDTPTGDEPSAPPADDEVAERCRNIEQELRLARNDGAELDTKRQGAVRAIRSLANDPKFESLQSRVGRQFAVAEEMDLESRASVWRKELEVRVQTIDAQLAEMDRHRELLMAEALAAGEDGLSLLRSAASHSRLPDHLPSLGGAHFLRIATHAPDDVGERRGRVGELIDQLVDEGKMPTGLELVQQAVRRLGKPIRVKVLNPDPDVDRAAVDITDMARFSGGEQLTGAILLYCTLAQLRARSRGKHRRHSSILVLRQPDRSGIEGPLSGTAARGGSGNGSATHIHHGGKRPRRAPDLAQHHPPAEPAH